MHTGMTLLIPSTMLAQCNHDARSKTCTFRAKLSEISRYGFVLALHSRYSIQNFRQKVGQFCPRSPRFCVEHRAKNDMLKLTVGNLFQFGPRCQRSPSLQPAQSFFLCHLKTVHELCIMNFFISIDEGTFTLAKMGSRVNVLVRLRPVKKKEDDNNMPNCCARKISETKLELWNYRNPNGDVLEYE